MPRGFLRDDDDLVPDVFDSIRPIVIPDPVTPGQEPKVRKKKLSGAQRRKLHFHNVIGCFDRHGNLICGHG